MHPAWAGQLGWSRTLINAPFAPRPKRGAGCQPRCAPMAGGHHSSVARATCLHTVSEGQASVGESAPALNAAVHAVGRKLREWCVPRQMQGPGEEVGEEASQAVRMCNSTAVGSKGPRRQDCAAVGVGLAAGSAGPACQRPPTLPDSLRSLAPHTFLVSGPVGLCSIPQRRCGGAAA